MKTIKQIADELGVSKQRVSRYIKNNRIDAAFRDRVALYYDNAAELSIKSHFLSPTTSGEPRCASKTDAAVDTLIAMLQKELDTKNRQMEAKDLQIAELTTALVSAQQTAAAAQALHAGTMHHLTDAQQGLFARIFGRAKKSG